MLYAFCGYYYYHYKFFSAFFSLSLFEQHNLAMFLHLLRKKAATLNGSTHMGKGEGGGMIHFPCRPDLFLYPTQKF